MHCPHGHGTTPTDLDDVHAEEQDVPAWFGNILNSRLGWDASQTVDSVDDHTAHYYPNEAETGATQA